MPYSEFRSLLHQGKIDTLAVSDRFIQGTLKEPLPGGQRRFFTTRLDQDFAQELGLFLGVPELLFERDCDPFHVPLARVFRHPPRERSALLEGPQARPERALDRLVLRAVHAVGRVRMSDPAAEPEEVSFLDLPEDPAAIGAAERRRGSRLVVVLHRFHVELRELRFLDHFFGHRADDALERIPAEPREKRPDLLERQHVIDLDVPQRRFRHSRAESVGRILHDRQTACDLDRDQSRGSVVERAGQNHADDARAVGPRRAAEERIDRRPMPVLGRSANDTDASGLDHQVTIRRRDVDVAVLDPFAVLGMGRRQRTRAGKNHRQQAGRLCRDVQNDEHRSGQVLRKVSREPGESFDASSRGSDHDHVPVRHCSSFGARPRPRGRWPR